MFRLVFVFKVVIFKCIWLVYLPVSMAPVLTSDEGQLTFYQATKYMAQISMSLQEGRRQPDVLSTAEKKLSHLQIWKTCPSMISQTQKIISTLRSFLSKSFKLQDKSTCLLEAEWISSNFEQLIYHSKNTAFFKLLNT